MAEKITKINIENAKPNMLLAEDVVTKSGIVILAKNTMLNDINFNKLMASDVKTIRVWTVSIDESLQNLKQTKHTIEEQMKPVVEREEYKLFSANYEHEIENTKNNLLAIGRGSDVDVESLYKAATNTISKVNCKYDVFNYLGYLKQSDDHTYSHSLNVSLLCNLFAKWAGMDEEATKNLTIAGILHDIGKTLVDKNVLNKKGRLTEQEFQLIKQHTVLGYKLLKDTKLPLDVKNAVLMHHEKMDGSGYPLGVDGTKIGRFAKIVAICDIYDAMTSERVYRGKICPFTVIKEFEDSSFGLLDTNSLVIFLQNIAYSYVGSWVRLSDGRDAEVIFINRQFMALPIVKTTAGEFIDLSQQRDKTTPIKIDHIV